MGILHVYSMHAALHAYMCMVQAACQAVSTAGSPCWQNKLVLPVYLVPTSDHHFYWLVYVGSLAVERGNSQASAKLWVLPVELASLKTCQVLTKEEKVKQLCCNFGDERPAPNSTMVFTVTAY